MEPHVPPPPPVIPRDDVAVRSYPPAALPTSTFPYVGAVEVPVPPFNIGKIPVTSLARLMSAVETVPAVAFKKPVSEPSVNEFDATRFEVEAYPAVRLVVDALVMVSLLPLLLNVKLEDAPSEPLLLNCTWVSEPATEPEPPSSAAHTTLPLASVVSVPPLPSEEQSSDDILSPCVVEVAETYRVVVVALSNIARVYVSSVPVREAIAADAVSIALDILPMIDAAVMEPPVMVGFVIVVLARLSMRPICATTFITPPLAYEEDGAGYVVPYIVLPKSSLRRFICDANSVCVTYPARDAGAPCTTRSTMRSITG